MSGPTLPASEVPPRLAKKSTIEIADERATKAATDLDDLCLKECGIVFSEAPPFDGVALMGLIDHDTMSEDDMVDWVKQHGPPNAFQDRMTKIKLVTLIRKVTTTEKDVDDAVLEIIKEDRGWPHRCAVYHDRLLSSKHKKRDPQRWFLGCGDPPIRAVQEGSDPDRYVPVAAPDRITIVGKIKNHQIRCEVNLNENTTVDSVTKQIAFKHGCNPDHSVLGYHGHPLHDKSLNLWEFGVLSGTVLHILPGWATVEEMHKALDSLGQGSSASKNKNNNKRDPADGENEDSEAKRAKV